MPDWAQAMMSCGVNCSKALARGARRENDECEGDGEYRFHPVIMPMQLSCRSRGL